MTDLYMVYKELPPSSNKIYFRGTRLTSVARAYGERFSYHIIREYLPQISLLDKKGVYALHLRFFLSNLVNETFYSKGKNRAETLYKRRDLSNMIKLLEDCIRDAIGIDDCQTFAASQEKHQVPQGEERVEILVQSVDPSQFGVPKWE